MGLRAAEWCDWYVIDQQGRLYIAYSERDAYYVRDTVGGQVYFEGAAYGLLIVV